MDGDESQDAALPSFDETKERVPTEIQNRTGIESSLSKWLQEIPTEARSWKDGIHLSVSVSCLENTLCQAHLDELMF